MVCRKFFSSENSGKFLPPKWTVQDRCSQRYVHFNGRMRGKLKKFQAALFEGIDDLFRTFTNALLIFDSLIQPLIWVLSEFSQHWEGTIYQKTRSSTAGKSIHSVSFIFLNLHFKEKPTLLFLIFFSFPIHTFKSIYNINA